MKTEKKLSAFAISMLLAVAVSAQPTPPSPPGGAPAPASPPSGTIHAPPPRTIYQQSPQPGGRPGMPPGLMNQPRMSGPPPEMPSRDKLSTAIGLYMGNSLKRDKLDVDLDKLVSALKGAVAGAPAPMTETEMRSTLQQLNQAMRYRMQHEREEAMEKQNAQLEKEAATNKIASEQFLDQHAKEAGVKRMPDGLEYSVLKDGDGPTPKPTDSVVVAYKGTLINGTEFDHNDNFKTRINGGIIRGWKEVLPMMKVGSKWQVVIPADLGYGSHGMPPRIPPGSALMFEMELKSIEAAPTAAMPPQGAPLASRSTTPVVSGQIIKVPSAEELKHGAKIEVITNVPPQ